MSMPTALINVMNNAARKASRLLMRDFGEVEQLQVSRKGPGDFVTEADRRADYQQCAPATEAGLYLVPKVIE